MKDISKLKSLESLLTKNGKLNAAITRQSWFQKLPIYEEILAKSSCLDIFENMSFAARFWILYDKMEIQHCKKCGAAYIDFPKLQQCYHLCRHPMSFNKESLIENRKAKYQANLAKLTEIVENGTLCLDSSVFSQLFDEIRRKKQNFQFLISERYLKFYGDLILKTSSILQFDKRNLRLSERFYIAQHDLKQLPKCRFCNAEDAEFINRIQGYSQACDSPECRHMLTIEKIDRQYEKEFESYKAAIDKNLDNSKYEVLQYPKILAKDPLVLRCKKCNSESSFYLINGMIDKLNKSFFYCKFCERKSSSIEREIQQFIVNECSCKQQDLKLNDRQLIKPLELDIYVPRKSLAIEVDGLYWHQADEANSKANYHANKTTLCEDKNVQLVHIFENEWEQKQEIVKSRLKNLFGIYEKRVFARKCSVKSLSSKDSRQFLLENHIQGHVNAKVNLGLFYGNDLVSLMTFGKTRFSKKYEWEMLRFCNKCGYHVPGAASKLLKHFEKTYQPKSLVSYADRRWSQGKLYEALRFQLDHVSKPDYWYFKNGNLESRIKYQKHKLKNLLEKFDENKTEVQNMAANGYSRIFDCGNLVFVKVY